MPKVLFLYCTYSMYAFIFIIKSDKCYNWKVPLIKSVGYNNWKVLGISIIKMYQEN